MMKKITVFLTVLLLSMSLMAGCASISKKGGVSMSMFDISAVSTLGSDRLAIVNLGDRERLILEKKLQRYLGVKRVKKYRGDLPRDDGSKIATVSSIGVSFVPQTPLGLKCKSFEIRITMAKRESIYGESIMCLDTLNDADVWERFPDLEAP